MEKRFVRHGDHYLSFLNSIFIFLSFYFFFPNFYYLSYYSFFFAVTDDYFLSYSSFISRFSPSGKKETISEHLY